MTILEGKVTWIDIENPQKSDIEQLKKIHDFHPIILDELLHLSARSKVEHYDSYLYTTYHFPIYDYKTKTSRRAELDMLVTKDHVITIHYEDLEPVRNFSQQLDVNAAVKHQVLSNGGYIAYYLLQEVNSFCERELRHIENNVAGVTKDLFAHQEYQMLQRISYVKRDILDFGVILKPQSLLLGSLHDVGMKFWGEALGVYLKDLVGDNLKISQQLDTFRETIESAEETNSQLLNSKTNAVMQRFTILAFLTFPLMLFTAVFSVDLVTSEIQDPKVFWLGFGAVFVVTVATIAIFKLRGLFRD